MADGDVWLRQLGVDDTPDVALVHLAAFPRSAITMMGRRAATRYYRWQLEGPHECHAVGAFEREKLVGFCFGGRFRGALSGFIRRQWWFLASCLALRPWALLQSEFRTRLRQGLRILQPASGQKRPQEGSATGDGRSFGILSIAVHPDRQGTGIGAALLRNAEAAARRDGFDQMRLSVSTENLRAVEFYEANGWVPVLEEAAWQGKMQKVLT